MVGFVIAQIFASTTISNGILLGISVKLIGEKRSVQVLTQFTIKSNVSTCGDHYILFLFFGITCELAGWVAWKYFRVHHIGPCTLELVVFHCHKF